MVPGWVRANDANMTLSGETVIPPRMATDVVLLIAYVVGALSISFVCSILEAALLSSRIADLSARKDEGDSGAAILLELKLNRLEDAIGAILTLNTIAHTIGAALAGAQAALVFGDAWVGVFSGVLTLLVLVFTEIIPKTVGTAYASPLAGIVGRTIALLTRVLAPILAVTRVLTRLVHRAEKPTMTRGELAAVVAMAASQGTLARTESRLLDNVLSLQSIQVKDVMTPRTVTEMLPSDASIADLVKSPGAAQFSRLPLFGSSRDEVLGYVVQRDALAALGQGKGLETKLADFIRPAWFLPATTSISAALRSFLERPEHMAIVSDEFGAVVGLVTLEDVLETILGAEILDESDQVADMRQLAIQIRDRRMAKLNERFADHGVAAASTSDDLAVAAAVAIAADDE